MNLKMEVHSYRYLRTMFYSKQDSREYHKNQPLMLVWGFMTLKNCLCFICKCLPALGRLTWRRQRLHLSWMQGSRGLLELAVGFLCSPFLVPVVEGLSPCHVASKYQVWTSILHILERSPRKLQSRHQHLGWVPCCSDSDLRRLHRFAMWCKW